MSKQYLLPCRCGNEVIVDSTQAGETVACSCGEQLLVPTLRGLRGLKPAGAAPAARPAPRRSTNSLGCLFAASLLVFVAATIAGVVAYTVRSNIDATVDEAKFLEVGDNMIDKMGIDEALEHWKQLEAMDLSHQGTPFYEINRQNRARWLRVIQVSAAVGGAALLVCGVLFVQSLRRK